MNTDSPSPGPHDARAAGPPQPPTGGAPHHRQRRHDDRPHPLRIAHRALRGRYALAGALALAGACTGALIGVRLGHRLYRATGLVRIAAVRAPVLKDTDQSQPVPMFDGVIEAQQEVMAGAETVRAAMADPAWARAVGWRRTVSDDQFAAALKVEGRRGSDHLRVTYTDPDPSVAAAAVRAVITAYRRAYDADAAQAQQQRFEALRHRRDALAADLRGVDEQIRLLAGPTEGAGTPPAVTLNAAFAAQEARDAVALAHLSEFGYGQGHPLIAHLRAAVVEEEANVARGSAEADEQLRRAEQERTDLAALAARAAKLRQSLDEVTNRLDLLTTEASLGSRLSVVSAGDRPMAPLLDTRARAATAGAAGGGGAPVLLIVLLSAARRRYRNPIELAEDLAGRAPFVAVVPEVDRRSPSAASAARAVHQLRVRVHRPLTPGARAYLLTAPTVGNGTTGVALSLGLSFAAAGHRTLLVDGNLAAPDLSRLLGAGDAPGFGDFGEGFHFHFGTLGAGLHFLPAGRCRPRDAAGLTTAHVRAVLDRARTQFDVILIDGDPLLAGVASAVMAHSVDGIILTLVRGQSHLAVREALRGLEQQGATVAGCVFNRAAGTGGSARRWALATLGVVVGRSGRSYRFGPLVASTMASLGLSDGPDLSLIEPAPGASAVDGSVASSDEHGPSIVASVFPTTADAPRMDGSALPIGDGELPIDEGSLPTGEGEPPAVADAVAACTGAFPIGEGELPIGQAARSIGAEPSPPVVAPSPVVADALSTGAGALPGAEAAGRALPRAIPNGAKKTNRQRALRKPVGAAALPRGTDARPACEFPVVIGEVAAPTGAAGSPSVGAASPAVAEASAEASALVDAVPPASAPEPSKASPAAVGPKKLRGRKSAAKPGGSKNPVRRAA